MKLFTKDLRECLHAKQITDNVAEIDNVPAFSNLGLGDLVYFKTEDDKNIITKVKERKSKTVVITYTLAFNASRAVKMLREHGYRVEQFTALSFGVALKLDENKQEFKNWLRRS